MLSQALSDAMEKLIRADGRPAEWAVSDGYVAYDAAVAVMEARAAAIAAGEAGEDEGVGRVGAKVDDLPLVLAELVEVAFQHGGGGESAPAAGDRFIFPKGHDV